MTGNEFLLLETLVLEGPLPKWKLFLFSGVNTNHWHAVLDLIDVGAIYCPRWGAACMITDKGRIAWAIQRGINQRQSASRRAAA